MSDRPSRLSRVFDDLAERIRASKLRSVGFTGAATGDGASTLALGTSLSLAADAAESVLLVDGNWLRPSLTADADGAARPGLADVLRGDAQLCDAVLTTARRGLAFLAAGQLNGDDPPLEALPSLLDNASSRFSALVVDLPPALAGESLVVPWASALQRLFVVVRSGVTAPAMLRRVVEEVALDSAQIVMNRTPSHAPEARPARVALT